VQTRPSINVVLVPVRGKLSKSLLHSVKHNPHKATSAHTSSNHLNSTAPICQALHIHCIARHPLYLDERLFITPLPLSATTLSLARRGPDRGMAITRGSRQGGGGRGGRSKPVTGDEASKFPRDGTSNSSRAAAHPNGSTSTRGKPRSNGLSQHQSQRPNPFASSAAVQSTAMLLGTSAPPDESPEDRLTRVRPRLHRPDFEPCLD
jgi:hypothetical protein